MNCGRDNFFENTPREILIFKIFYGGNILKMIFERKWFLDIPNEASHVVNTLRGNFVGLIVILTDVKEETRKLIISRKK